MKFNLKEKVIYWDFDGVIVFSEPIRDSGFRKSLSHYNESDVNKLLEFHKINGGLSRYVKFNFFFKEILKFDEYSSELKLALKNYNEFMLTEFVKQNPVNFQAISFIKKTLKSKKHHLISASDENELIHICNELNLTDCFISINGSPTPKLDNLQIVTDKYSYSKNNIVYIGDSINDYEAAKTFGCNFFGYNNLALMNQTSNYINFFDEFIV